MHKTITRLSIGLGSFILLIGCSAPRTKQEPPVDYNAWMKEYKAFSFENLLNDYLASNPVTPERVLWYINSDRELRKEYLARKETGLGVDALLEKAKQDIENRKLIGKYKNFHPIPFYDYNPEGGYFELTEPDMIGRQEYFYGIGDAASRDNPGWYQITARTDMRGWKWVVPPEDAYQIVSNTRDRSLRAYFTYELAKCESTQDSGRAAINNIRLGNAEAHLILCDFKVTGIRFYNTSTIYGDTLPFGQATFVGK